MLLGIAAGLKLQLAAPFIVYFLFVMRWRLFSSACLTLLVIAGIAIGRLEAAHIAWWGNWISNIRHTASGGGPNDYVTGNANRDHLLNLQVLFYALFQSRVLANALTGILVTAGAIIYLIQLCQHRDRDLLRDLAPWPC